MTRARRLAFWGTFLGGAGVLAALAPSMDPPAPAARATPTAQPVALAALRAVSAMSGPPASLRQASAPAAPSGPVPTGPAAGAPAGLFAAKSWERPPAEPAPAPPAEAAPEPEAAPAPPPLPYRFLGRLDAEGQLRVFLQRGERVHVVTVGDVVDGEYRIEGLDAGQLRLLYLPLAIQQTLAAGSS